MHQRRNVHIGREKEKKTNKSITIMLVHIDASVKKSTNIVSTNRPRKN